MLQSKRSIFCCFPPEQEAQHSFLSSVHSLKCNCSICPSSRTLFLFQVHKSLPLEVLQQKDAGLIKVLVRSVINGSRVVSFNLLLADVDVHHVITTFCEVLEHSS